ncbi:MULTISPECIES: hypothetical protein [unclassified Paenibacillus]|uniref:hypothetical protein n=1 Tax=unclassified Paenibacillus TaxID=185978 RepID=UPI0009A63D61|nr:MULTISPECIES: hypothetical protein [unclassified Paenibacillus]SLK20812.1 hypothetical protein SAMN06272722_11714 [Paenibacillus sp. RU5A]SOC76307.1 hypothetical protein SAMN05880581_11714 [Paenibacillus sp. RU26A]SOC77965.1 hypothetical protein SAMN05880586_11767 [Paenibacillus sp. RU5M]
MTNHLKADVGIATITAQGILFNGRFYTNRAVIKKKWFVLAREEGQWRIPVVYLHNYYEAIIIDQLGAIFLSRGKNMFPLKSLC